MQKSQAADQGEFEHLEYTERLLIRSSSSAIERMNIFNIVLYVVTAGIGVSFARTNRKPVKLF
jgi:hypothetical protein